MHWKFRAAEYPEAADEIFAQMRSAVRHVGGNCTTDGQYFHITGDEMAHRAALLVLADYGAEWELKAVPDRGTG